MTLKVHYFHFYQLTAYCSRIPQLMDVDAVKYIVVYVYCFGRV